jgi:predicted phage terminase large subunit-like protein
MITDDELDLLKNNLHKLTPFEQQELFDALNELERRRALALAQKSLLDFVTFIDPDYKVGSHHKHLAALLENMAFGRKDRIIVNIAPRFGKSQLTSIYFPAWFIGNWPNKKMMLVSHTSDLAVDFGRKVRNVVSQEKYQEVFPDVTLAVDSKSAGRWNTNKGGEFFACGVGAAIAGRGADLLVVDDPHSEQDVLAGNFDVFDRAYSWYTSGARTRLMPRGRVAVVMTRWHEADLTGRLLKDMIRKPDADQWNLVEFPAVFETAGPEGSTYKSLWPDQWDVEELLRTKATMAPHQWNAQYMQNPTAAESSIIKREWWRKWEKDEPPPCEYIIMSLDTASEAKTRSDYTVITTWGIFQRDGANGTPEAHIILLNCIRERWEFPTLKHRALEEYKTWNPDWFVVEKKSSGIQLFQEMRSIGVPVQEYTPHRGSGDKTARLNSVADIFSSGFVWYPVGRRWAEDLVEEVCGFPNMQYDDQVDSTVIALLRYRNGGFIKLPSDAWRDDDYVPRRTAYY